QTSELQSTLFGGALRAGLDLADTDVVKDPDAARDRLAGALAAATGADGGRPGPVQLNLGFADPLVPDGEDPPWALPAAAPPQIGSPAGEVLRLPPGPRTVVLAGDGAGPHARTLAEAAGWPLLAEPSSGARGGPHAV